MKIVITGGGTGGHIYPGLSVGLELIEKGWKELYIGSVDGLEAAIIPENNLNFKSVSVAPLPRKITPALLTSIIKNSKGFFQARKIIKDFNPDCILGTGGFVAGSIMLAGATLGIPTMIHEQNVYPGVTNRLLARFVDKIALNFADARDYFSSKVINKTVITGNPIRRVILDTNRETGINKLGFDSNKRTLLIFGGSQGAASINQALSEIYNKFLNINDIQLLHITGKKNYNKLIKDLKSKYSIDINKIDHIKVLPYLHNIEWGYAAADLIVYRAGATGLAEITAKGIPAILIPYPHAAGDHQLYNARTMQEHGAAEIIKENDLTVEILYKKIFKILYDEQQLNKMAENSKKLGQPDARAIIINEINKLVNNK